MTEWICRRKPFWAPTGDTFQKACLKEWQRFVVKVIPWEDIVRTNSGTTESAKLLKPGVNGVTFKYEQMWDAPSSPRCSRQAVGEPDAPTWKLSGIRSASAFWEKSEAPLPHQIAVRIIYTQNSTVLSRVKLPFPDETVLERHAADKRKAQAEFREASAGRQDTSNQEYHFDNNLPNFSCFFYPTSTIWNVHLKRKPTQRSMNVSDVKVIDEDDFLPRSMVIKAKNIIMKE